MMIQERSMNLKTDQQKFSNVNKSRTNIEKKINKVSETWETISKGLKSMSLKSHKERRERPMQEKNI